MNTTDELDVFESRLLDELKGVVADGARHRRSTWVRWAAAAAAVVTATGAVAFSSLTHASPAYALTPNADGSITVTVHRLEGAAALAADLKAHGINADVTFNAPGTQCQDNRGTPAPLRHVTMGATMSEQGQALILPAQMLLPGETLVIETSWPEPGVWALGSGIVQGPVAPCVPEPADQPVVPTETPNQSPSPIACGDLPGGGPQGIPADEQCVVMVPASPQPTK
ncbi:MAG: hypothetical protein WAV45_08025 [Propionibacteriaceae bacterium]|nr:hypothetical protein [Micropruina sp.]